MTAYRLNSECAFSRVHAEAEQGLDFRRVRIADCQVSLPSLERLEEQQIPRMRSEVERMLDAGWLLSD